MDRFCLQQQQLLSQPQLLLQPQPFPPQPKRMMIRMISQMPLLQELQNIVIPFSALRYLLFRHPARQMAGMAAQCSEEHRARNGNQNRFPAVHAIL